MKPLDELTYQDISQVKIILTDIDDTLTTKGKLEKESYLALWDLYDAGYIIIPVTGCSAGWCDLMVRQWPVHGIIGESGAFIFYIKDGVLHHQYAQDLECEKSRVKLDKLKKSIHSAYPHAKTAKDQHYRLFDLAIDYNQEPPYMEYEAAQEIKELCHTHGAEARISSIHINTWYGTYNKLTTARSFLLSHYGIDTEQSPGSVIYVGDSPNDEPMFHHFPLSFAVANIERFLDTITYKPAYAASEPGGRGFAQVARKLLSLKGDCSL